MPSAERWRQLPEQLVGVIKSLTGVDGAKQRNIAHLAKEYPRKQDPIVWILGFVDEAGLVYGRGKELVVTLDVFPEHFYFQTDYKRSKTSVDKPGQLDPSITVHNADHHPIPFGADGLVKKCGRQIGIFSPSYYWFHQYFNELPDSVQSDFFYQKFDPSNGRRIGDSLKIHAREPKALCALSTIPSDGDASCCTNHSVMAGATSSILVRPGMGVCYQNPVCTNVPQLAEMMGVVCAVSPQEITVRVLMGVKHMPPLFNSWSRVGVGAVLQTNIGWSFDPRLVRSVFASRPSALWQFPGLSDGGEPGKDSDVYVVAHVDFLAIKKQEHDDPQTILQGAYGVGPLSGPGCVKIHLHPVVPMDATAALKMAAVDMPSIFGSLHRGLGTYLHYVRTALFEWVRSKPQFAKTTSANNTLHLGMDGWLFARLIYEYLDLAECTTSLRDGILCIDVPGFESAKRLLGVDSGAFDLTGYGHGYIVIFAPIVFKWEIYDTTRGKTDSRSPDGFTAITFAGYEERDRHNMPGGLKETLHHPEAERQKRKRVSACPRD